MEKLVASLETCKLLKSAEFPQEAACYWRSNTQSATTGLTLGHPNMTETEHIKVIAAPTAQEIADQLPDSQLRVEFDHSLLTWSAYFPKTQEYDAFDNQGDTMVDALAALWLKSQEATP